MSIPVIASGGAGRATDFPAAIDAGADAVLAASVFHFGVVSIGSVRVIAIGRPNAPFVIINGWGLASGTAVAVGVGV